MKTHLTALVILACFLTSCAVKKPVEVYPTLPARIVTVTNTEPSVRVVQRQAEQVSIKLADANKKVEQLSANIDTAVDEAIRSGNQANEIDIKKIQAQVKELDIVVRVATDTAKALQDDIDNAKAELAKVAVERDVAVKEREAIRNILLTERQATVAKVTRLDEQKLAEAARAAWWKKKALWTWGAISSVALIGVGLKVMKYI